MSQHHLPTQPPTIASLLKFRLMLWGKFRERLFSYLAIYIKCFLPWGLMDLASSLSYLTFSLDSRPFHLSDFFGPGPLLTCNLSADQFQNELYQIITITSPVLDRNNNFQTYLVTCVCICNVCISKCLHGPSPSAVYFPYIYVFCTFMIYVSRNGANILVALILNRDAIRSVRIDILF